MEGGGAVVAPAGDRVVVLVMTHLHRYIIIMMGGLLDNGLKNECVCCQLVN